MNQLPVQLLGASTLYSAEELGGAESIDPFIFQGSHPESNVFLFFSCTFILQVVAFHVLLTSSQSWIRQEILRTAARTVIIVKS